MPSYYPFAPELLVQPEVNDLLFADDARLAGYRFGMDTQILGQTLTNQFIPDTRINVLNFGQDPLVIALAESSYVITVGAGDIVEELDGFLGRKSKYHESLTQAGYAQHIEDASNVHLLGGIQIARAVERARQLGILPGKATNQPAIPKLGKLRSRIQLAAPPRIVRLETTA